MYKKRFFIVCIISVLCVLLISTKVKAIKYTDERQYIESTKVLAYEIQNNTINRNKTFQVLAKTTFDKPVNINVLNNYADKLVKKAMSEELAKTSSAGDYLNYSWDEYKKSISGFYSYENFKYNYYLTITYKFTYYTSYNQEKRLDRDIKDFIKNNIKTNDSNLNKISKIYNYISNNVKYKKNIGNIKYSAYSAFENKSAICQGYSTLLYKMLKEANIENVRVVRSSSHSWNIVKIGNLYYHLDATWEATSNKRRNYNYILKDSNEINKINKHKIHSEYNTKTFKSKYPISSKDYMKVNINKLKKTAKRKIKIKWEKNSSCDGYIIEYSKNKNFKNAKKITINNNNIDSKTIKNLQKNKKYYMRICTFKKNNFFEWANTKSIII